MKQLHYNGFHKAIYRQLQTTKLVAESVATALTRSSWLQLQG